MTKKEQESKDEFQNKKDETLNVNRAGRNPIPSDVLGSYTGVGEDGERPIQDADDL